jgi:hypothetical protein
MMTPAEYAFVISQIFLARTLTPFAALLVAGFWLLFAAYKGL